MIYEPEVDAVYCVKLVIHERHGAFRVDFWGVPFASLLDAVHAAREHYSKQLGVSAERVGVDATLHRYNEGT